jgi:aldose 1-epimerase
MPRSTYRWKLLYGQSVTRDTRPCLIGLKQRVITAMDAAEAGSILVCGALDETPVHRITLRGGDLAVSILTYGATIQDLVVQGPSDPRNVVLGFDTCDEYLAQRLYMGSVAGRFANRIAAGRFTLDGTPYQLSRNENGVNHLHGGANGFSRRVWSVAQVTERAVALSLVSPAGEEGYPGTLTATCRYSIEGERCLRIALSAATDAPTVVNLATHSYFNLAGEGDILGHRLQIPAQTYLPTDAALIPTGELASVTGTGFDFRTLRPVRLPDAPTQRYDNTLVLAPSDGQVRQAARLECAGIALELWSTEPGVQLYDSGSMRTIAGRGGATYRPFSGLCLEPQRFPDSPNQPGFTDCTLRPGETYRQITEYRFELT